LCRPPLICLSGNKHFKHANIFHIFYKFFFVKFFSGINGVKAALVVSFYYCILKSCKIYFKTIFWEFAYFFGQSTVAPKFFGVLNQPVLMKIVSLLQIKTREIGYLNL